MSTVTKQVQHLVPGDMTRWYTVLNDPSTTSGGLVQVTVQHTDGGIDVRVWDDPEQLVQVIGVGNVETALEGAREEIVRSMNRMTTELRRVEEMATAVANQTGRPEDRKVAEQAGRAATRADEAADALLRGGS